MLASDPKFLLSSTFIARRRDLRVVAIRLVERTEVVDDVMQDAYLKLMGCAGACIVRNPYAYCCQIVRNTAFDYFRSRAAEAHVIEPTLDGELPDVAGEWQVGVGLDERRLLQRIDEILDALPSRTRHVFELHRLHGKTQREIGKIIGVSATLVNFMIKDVMQALVNCRAQFDQ